jgi:hypothetical protein
MSYTQSPPLAEDEWIDPGSADAPLRNPDPRADRRSPQRRAAKVQPPRAFGRNDVQELAYRPSRARRFLGSLVRFVIAASIGVGGTIAAQTETAKQLLGEQAPTLAWLLSVSPSKPIGATAAPMQQPGPSAADVEAVRRSVEQLAARQDQMAQSVAALQAVGEDIRQKLSSMPALPQQAAAVPQPRAPQARGPLSAGQPAPFPAPGAGSVAPTR